MAVGAWDPGTSGLAASSQWAREPGRGLRTGQPGEHTLGSWGSAHFRTKGQRARPAGCWWPGSQGLGPRGLESRSPRAWGAAGPAPDSTALVGQCVRGGCQLRPSRLQSQTSRLRLSGPELQPPRCCVTSGKSFHLSEPHKEVEGVWESVYPPRPGQPSRAPSLPTLCRARARRAVGQVGLSRDAAWSSRGRGSKHPAAPVILDDCIKPAKKSQDGAA